MTDIIGKLPAPEQEAVLKISQLAKQEGGSAFLVGGCVRDALTGSVSKDVDVEVFGIAPDTLQTVLARHFDLDLVGASFGVIKLHHLNVDVSLPRSESKIGTGHRGFEISSNPRLSIAEASSRRDFTINAIYCNPLTGELIDQWNGLHDIENSILRHVSESFCDDPLRVLRGMQFVARFDLRPDPSTVELCRTITPEGLAKERQFDEWSKLLLKGRSISAGLDFLRRTGWVEYYPELAALIGCMQNPKWHAEGDVWNHTCRCLDAFAAKRIGDDNEDLVVGLAVLCHDFGKPATTVLIDGDYRSPGHDVQGLDPTLSFLRRLTNEERILREVPPLVTQHMQPYALCSSNASDGAVRRLALRVGRVDRLIRVGQADRDGQIVLDEKGGNKTCHDLEWLTAAAERLRIAAEVPKPILLGRDVVSAGIKPSPLVGEIVRKCFQAQLDGAFSSHEGALDFMKALPELRFALDDEKGGGNDN